LSKTNFELLYIVENWKVHIPLENIDGVIEALQKAKALM
jgi:hypothetical protein